MIFRKLRVKFNVSRKILILRRYSSTGKVRVRSNWSHGTVGQRETNLDFAKNSTGALILFENGIFDR